MAGTLDEHERIRRYVEDVHRRVVETREAVIYVFERNRTVRERAHAVIRYAKVQREKLSATRQVR